MKGARSHTCRGCGCIDRRACVTPHGPCCWIVLDVHTATGLCSACADEFDWDQAAIAAIGTREAWRVSGGELLQLVRS